MDLIIIVIDQHTYVSHEGRLDSFDICAREATSGQKPICKNSSSSAIPQTSWHASKMKHEILQIRWIHLSMVEKSNVLIWNGVQSEKFTLNMKQICCIKMHIILKYNQNSQLINYPG